MDMDAARPFAQTPIPAPVQVPRWLQLVVGGALGAGALVGLLTGGAGGGARIVRPIFFAAAFGYLATSLVDFAEHFRLEKKATGRYWTATVVPLGESVNHALTILTIGGALALARPLPQVLGLRDYFVLVAPALFLALGWRDELVYHRRRSGHREDMMHTVSHLAAATMLTAFYVMRLEWR